MAINIKPTQEQAEESKRNICFKLRMAINKFEQAEVGEPTNLAMAGLVSECRNLVGGFDRVLESYLREQKAKGKGKK